jgi:hypothetical protein
MYAARFQCAGCGEWVETSVDESAGSKQQYVEDCQICCRPNVLTVRWMGRHRSLRSRRSWKASFEAGTPLRRTARQEARHVFLSEILGLCTGTVERTR